MIKGLPKEDLDGLDSSDMELVKKMYYDAKNKKNSTTNGSPPYAPQTPEYPPSPDYPADSPPYAPPDDIPVETTPVEEEVSLLTEIDNATEISDTANDSDPSAKKRVTIDI